MSTMAYYIQTNLLCILMLLLLYRQTLSGKGMVPAKQLAFGKIILASVAMCLSDCVAWLANGEQFQGVQAVLQVSNIVNYGSITWMGYTWLNYVGICVGMLKYNSKRRTFLAMTPALVLSLLLILNPLTGMFFTFDANNVYSRGPFIILHWLVSWGYLVVATFVVFLKYRKTKNRSERKELRTLLTFIVMPAIGAVIQMMFYGITTTQCGITLSVLLILSQNVREQISNDVLTGLNNRRAFENYVDDQILRFGKNFTIVMCDIDKFKAINDTYGHAYGDIALQRIADVLKNACADSLLPLFLCRYGGDEFIICGSDISLTDVLNLRRKINEGLARCNNEHTEQNGLAISVGISSGVCWTENDVDRLVRTADQEMYKDKNSRR